MIPRVGMKFRSAKGADIDFSYVITKVDHLNKEFTYKFTNHSSKYTIDVTDQSNQLAGLVRAGSSVRLLGNLISLRRRTTV